MDWSTILAAGAAVVAAANTLYTWLTAASKANAKQIAEVEARLGNLGDRVTVAERNLAHVPQAQQVHELEVAMTRLAGQLQATTERLDGVGGWVKRLDRVSERIEQFLLDQGAKR